MPTLTTSAMRKFEAQPEETVALAAAPPTEISPMQMIQSALERGASMEQINQLLDLKDRIEAGDAKKAFVAAMSRFKANTIPLTKDKVNNQYTTATSTARYTSLGNMVQTVTPYLSQNNLSARWDVEQLPIGIKVTCIITHAQGHAESVAMIVPPDKSGAKNPIQEIKSAITYAKACTFESICGLASTDGNVDDDGNGAGGSKPSMPEQEVVACLDSIANAAHLSELHTIYTAAYKAAQEVQDDKGKRVGDKAAQKAFIAAKDKRKAELA